MALRINPETGHLQQTGTDTGDRQIASARLCYEVFSGPKGDQLASEITQDFINRGLRAPLAIKAVRMVNDLETKESTRALRNVEQLRKIRLQREKFAGRISEAEYQMQLNKGEVL